MAIKFFEVTAKCGHVGRHQYYEGIFYERALDARDAATIVRNRPRVKHDHKDAILGIEEISYDEFNAGQVEFEDNPYHKCESRWQQLLIWKKMVPNLHPETNLQYDYRKAEHRSVKLPACAKPKFKKPYKRERLPIMSEYDYALEI